MDNKAASMVLECIATDMTGAIADMSKRSPMYDVVEQRLEAINVAQEALKAPIIDLSDDDFGAVLNCAIRYCLGRRTYMPGLVTDYVRPLLPYVNQKTLSVLKQDIAEQAKSGYGDACDAKMWERFLADVRRSLNEPLG